MKTISWTASGALALFFVACGGDDTNETDSSTSSSSTGTQGSSTAETSAASTTSASSTTGATGSTSTTGATTGSGTSGTDSSGDSTAGLESSESSGADTSASEASGSSGGETLGSESGETGGSETAGVESSESGSGSGTETGEPAPLACDEYESLVIGDGSFELTVAGFDYCDPIPAQHTCDGQPFPEGASPMLTWESPPEGTGSFAVVFKDIAIIESTPTTEQAHNRGFHWVMWDIPAETTTLPAEMEGGHLSTDIPGARQWSNFNDYAYFGPCPNFNPEMPTTQNDSYAFVIYALEDATAEVPAPQTGISTVRLMDDYFASVALAAAEYRGTSDAEASVLPDGVLPPMTNPPCPTVGEQPEGCLEGVP